MYPLDATSRDAFVLARRGPRNRHDPWRYLDVTVESERTEEGTIAETATVFLTGRECPWRCAMCDLWQHTTVDDTPVGAIPTQVAAARRATDQRGGVSQLKLYNAGSFFDTRAVPGGDYSAIADHLCGLRRVIVESHPALIGPRVDRFLEALHRRCGQFGSTPQLEIAMGLETAHPEALECLNKRMTVESFEKASDALRHRAVSLRVFLLIAPPFIKPADQDSWLERSIEVALSCDATAISLIPTRDGNGTMEVLAKDGSFHAPRLGDIERSFECALAYARGRARVFVDLWSVERFARCGECFEARRSRLHAMNLEQHSLSLPACSSCALAV